MTSNELQADLPGWDLDSLPPELPASSSGPSDEPRASDESPKRAPRARRSRGSTDVASVDLGLDHDAPSRPALGVLFDPYDPSTEAKVGKAAGAAFRMVGQLLHQTRTPARTHGLNDVWLVTNDERDALAGPAGALIAKHTPVRLLAAAFPFIEMLGDGGEVGAVLTGYGSKNLGNEAALRRMIQEELARLSGEREGAGPTDA